MFYIKNKSLWNIKNVKSVVCNNMQYVIIIMLQLVNYIIIIRFKIYKFFTLFI